MTDAVPHQVDGRRSLGGSAPSLGPNDPRSRRALRHGPERANPEGTVGRDASGKLTTRIDPKSPLKINPTGELSVDLSRLTQQQAVMETINTTVAGGGGSGGGGTTTTIFINNPDLEARKLAMTM